MDEKLILHIDFSSWTKERYKFRTAQDMQETQMQDTDRDTK